MITDDLPAARTALESAARDFDPSRCSGQDAVALMEDLGAIRRLADGLIGRVTKRVEDTAAHTYGTDRSAAELCARVVGVSSGEAKRAIDVAGKLEALPATDAAMRAGRLSARQADLIVGAAEGDPELERDLLKAADKGLVPLREAVIAARAAREDQTSRSTRQHAARSFRSWTNADGMYEGHFQVTPEIGGAIKATIEDGTRRRFRKARSNGARESHDAYAADAFADAILGRTDSATTDPAAASAAKPAAKPRTTRGPVGYTAHVVIDHEVLVRGNALAGETCEIPGVGPVNAEWARTLLGAAFVTAIIKKGKDITMVAHLGRHIPAELRTAMIVSGRECTIDGCTGREYLELDHSEIDHAKHGPTAWWNLAWLCSIHHTRKTQGWTLGPPDPVTRKRRLDPPATTRRATTRHAA